MAASVVLNLNIIKPICRCGFITPNVDLWQLPDGLDLAAVRNLTKHHATTDGCHKFTGNCHFDADVAMLVHGEYVF
jgi:hypothetical protein